MNGEQNEKLHYFVKKSAFTVHKCRHNIQKNSHELHRNVVLLTTFNWGCQKNLLKQNTIFIFLEITCT